MVPADEHELTLDGDDRLRRRHAEGVTIYSIPAAVFVVRDEFISTVCSGCLKTKHPQNTLRLQQCSKCKFVRYCSRECQTLDWQNCHKDECGMLKAVWKSCPNQDSSFARLFARNVLKINNKLKASGAPCLHNVMGDYWLEQRGKDTLEMFHQPQNCRKIFKTWKPILDALDRHHNTNVRKFGAFMNTMAEHVIGNSTPMFEAGLHHRKEPIAFCSFVNKTMYNPVYDPNAVFVPVIDPVHGPIVRVKAVRQLKGGERVLCAEANNLLISPINIRSQEMLVMGSDNCAERARLYIGGLAEILCVECGKDIHLVEPKWELLGEMENIRFLDLFCKHCGFSARSHRISDLLIVRLAKLTSKSLPQTEQYDRKLSAKVEELKDLISMLRPGVASTSFALGIAYRELADVYEKLGQMDKCVEAHKMVIPIVEKHLHKYDQNIFDGLSRAIVYHLERQEITESLPYIEKAWERLQKIPGKDSFDFHVVDKLRKAVRNKADFSFSKFCSVEPT